MSAIDAGTTNTIPMIVAFQAPDRSKKCTAFLTMHTDGFPRFRIEGSTANVIYQDNFSSQVVPDVFGEYALDIVPDGSGGLDVSVSFGGAPALPKRKLTECGFGGDVDLQLGHFCAEAPSRELLIDDVIYDDKP